MPPLHTLPGELRNEIYTHLLPSPPRLSPSGVLIPPSLAATSTALRAELTSLLNALPHAALEAQAIDFDTAPLHAFLLSRAAAAPAPTLTLHLHLTAPGKEKAHGAALRAFLAESRARGWRVGWRVRFDWRGWSLGQAAECARGFEPGAGGSGVGEEGEGLWRAMRKAREAEVRRCLVERPARLRDFVREGGRGRGVGME